MIRFENVDITCFRYSPPRNWVPATLPEYLDSLKIAERAGADEQALLRCPESVRAAIAGRYLWWYLARSHSSVVRSFAHAYCRAMSTSGGFNPVGTNCDNGQSGFGVSRPAQDGKLGTHRSFPHRLLHFFLLHLQGTGACGPNAKEMVKSSWDQDERPGCLPVPSNRGYSDEYNPGCVARVSSWDFTRMRDRGHLVKCSKSLWNDFCDIVTPWCQPLMSQEFAREHDMLPPLPAPCVYEDRPRSKKAHQVIPLALKHGMQQIVDELPLQSEFIFRQSDYRSRVLSEIKWYSEVREDDAIKAMANRANLSAWLRAYDEWATVMYCKPTVVGQTRQMPHGVVQIVGGLRHNYSTNFVAEMSEPNAAQKPQFSINADQ